MAKKEVAKKEVTINQQGNIIVTFPIIYDIFSVLHDIIEEIHILIKKTSS